MTLPADGHVHSQWSWDAPGGALVRVPKTDRPAVHSRQFAADRFMEISDAYAEVPAPEVVRGCLAEVVRPVGPWLRD